MSRQIALAAKNTSSKKTMTRTMSPAGAAAGAEVLVAGAHAVERLLCRLRFFGVRSDLQDLLPGRGGALEILFAEGAHDALVQQRLRVRGVHAERVLELRERA